MIAKSTTTSNRTPPIIFLASLFPNLCFSTILVLLLAGAPTTTTRSNSLALSLVSLLELVGIRMNLCRSVALDTFFEFQGSKKSHTLFKTSFSSSQKEEEEEEQQQQQVP
jgi:hypothetical protein